MATFLLEPNATTLQPGAQTTQYGDKEKIMKEPRSKGQKRGSGKGFREQNKQQKAEQVLQEGEVSHGSLVGTEGRPGMGLGPAIPHDWAWGREPGTCMLAIRGRSCCHVANTHGRLSSRTCTGTEQLPSPQQPRSQRDFPVGLRYRTPGAPSLPG